MHQQPPLPHRVLIENIALFIGRDVHSVDEQLPFPDGTPGVAEIQRPGADGFDLRPGKFDPGLVMLLNEIIVSGLAVLGREFDARFLLRSASPFLSCRSIAHFSTPFKGVTGISRPAPVSATFPSAKKKQGFLCETLKFQLSIAHFQGFCYNSLARGKIPRNPLKSIKINFKGNGT